MFDLQIDNKIVTVGSNGKLGVTIYNIKLMEDQSKMGDGWSVATSCKLRLPAFMTSHHSKFSHYHPLSVNHGCQ